MAPENEGFCDLAAPVPVNPRPIFRLVPDKM